MPIRMWCCLNNFTKTKYFLGSVCTTKLVKEKSLQRPETDMWQTWDEDSDKLVLHRRTNRHCALWHLELLTEPEIKEIYLLPWHPCWQAPVRASVFSVLTEPVIVLLIVSCSPRPQHNPSSQSLTRGGWWAGGICQADFWKHNTHNHYSVTRNVTLDLELFKSFKLNFQTVKWKFSSLGVSSEMIEMAENMKP